MSKHGLLLALLAALAVGWLVGSLAGGGWAGDADEEAARLREENARLRLALGERVNPGDADRGGPRMGTGDGTEGEGGARPTVGAEDFDLARFDAADPAFQALLLYAAAMLDRGPEGHLPLLETLNATFSDAGEKRVRALAGDDARRKRYLYPVLRFALHREDQLADLAETVLATMAREPARFETLEGEALALLCEEVLPLLPGVVGPKRMQDFEAHARAILAADPAGQPNAIRRHRGDIHAALVSWLPPISADEAFQRLQRGGLGPEEATALLRQLAPEDVARLDLDRLTGPLLQRDPWLVIRALGAADLGEETIRTVDDRILEAAVAGRLRQAVVTYWLRHTDREGFPQARTFLETGLQRASKETAGAFFLSALACKPPPPDDWITWAEGRYEFSDEVRLALLRLREARKRDGDK